MDRLENLAKILKGYGLRKMVFGFLMFLGICGLVFATKLDNASFTTVALAVIGGMFAGNVGEHFADRKKD